MKSREDMTQTRTYIFLKSRYDVNLYGAVVPSKPVNLEL